MKNIIVTGANGMVGRHMMALLKDQETPAIGFTRQDWDLSKWKSIAELDNLFGDVQAVFHFGAHLPRSSIDHDNQQTQLIFDTNIRSCLNISEWAILRDVPVVFLSGAVVYENPNGLRISEDAPKVINGFGGFYGYSKLMAESIINHFVADGLQSIILRPSSIYGCGLSHKKLVQKYINIALSSEIIHVSEPENRINFIHAYDVAFAALSAYQYKAWGVFNISAERNCSIVEIAETAVLIARSGSFDVDEDKSKISSKFTRFDLDSGLAVSSFGFQSKVTLEYGMLLVKEGGMML